MIPRQRKNKDSLPDTDMTFNEQPPIVVEARAAALAIDIAARLERLLASQASIPTLCVALKTPGIN